MPGGRARWRHHAAGQSLTPNADTGPIYLNTLANC